MLPGPILVIACPKCHAPARLPTLESGNTFGATFWTDGFVDAPMLPASPVATQCRACKALFWVGDAPRLGQIDVEGPGAVDEHGEVVSAGTLEAWDAAPEVRPLTRAQYHRALESEMVTTDERERVLRTLAWHASNVPRRRGKAAALDDRDRRNLERLLDLTRAALFDAALSAAELARELGRFEDVPGYLALPFPEQLEATRRRMPSWPRPATRRWRPCHEEMVVQPSTRTISRTCGASSCLITIAWRRHGSSWAHLKSRTSLTAGEYLAHYS